MKIRIEQEIASIAKMQALIDERANKKTLNEKIEGLKIIKYDFNVKGEYEEAIKTSKKIIEYAIQLDLKSVIKKEEKSIEMMKKRLAKAPLKTDPTKQIEGLRAVKQDYIVKFNFTQAIKITQKIINNYAKVLLRKNGMLYMIS